MDDVFYVVDFVKNHYIGYYSFADYLDYIDSSPINQLEWELVEGRSHCGPGLAAVINLDPLNPGCDRVYSEVLAFFSERGCPWVARNDYSHYNPAAWNEENDSLVRPIKERKKRPENYNQLLLGVSLV